MDTAKAFKNPPELREYWRIHKRKKRAEAEKVKKLQRKNEKMLTFRYFCSLSK